MVSQKKIYIGRHLHLVPLNNTWVLSHNWSPQQQLPPKKKEKNGDFLEETTTLILGSFFWGAFEKYPTWPPFDAVQGTKSFASMACSPNGCESSDASNSMGAAPWMIHVKDSQEYHRRKEIVFAVLKSKLILKSTKNKRHVCRLLDWFHLGKLKTGLLLESIHTLLEPFALSVSWVCLVALNGCHKFRLTCCNVFSV